MPCRRTWNTSEEAEKVMGMPDTTHVVGLRDRAILELLWRPGCGGWRWRG